MTKNKDSVMTDGLARIDEAVSFLGLSRSKVYALMASGELPVVRIGRNRRIPRRALAALAERCLTEGRQGAK